jgi:hypothetical protein
VERTPGKSYQLFRIILNNKRTIAFLKEKKYMRFTANGFCAPHSKRAVETWLTATSIAILI